MSEIVWKRIEGFWNPQQEKDEISGKLLQVKEEVGEFKTKGFVLETEKNIMTISGCAVLNRKMETIAIGDFVKIVFLGEREGKDKGKKDYKDFDVLKGVESS